MYAVYVLACTLQLTTFSLRCNLSEPDMPSLNQCGKLLNTTSFKQGAIVPAGKGTRSAVSLAAALQHRQLQSSNAKTELDAASPAQPPRAVAPQKTPRWGAATSHGSARRGERGDRQYGMATMLQGSLLVPVLIVLFHAVRFELNRMKLFLATIPA